MLEKLFEPDSIAVIVGRIKRRPYGLALAE
jgi:acyl-CoA synthetase (NDP forming)